MVDNILSEDDYKEILQNRFKDPEIKFVSAEIKPLSENIEGFMGDHFKLKITYELNNETNTEPFFVKTAPVKTQAQKEVIIEMNFYEKEIFLYGFLLKEYEKYGYDTSFAPKCYYCIPKKTMVMEDVSVKNFVLSERGKFYDLQQMKTAFRALALFHGAAFAYEQEKSKELGKPFSILEEYPKILEEQLFLQYIHPNQQSIMITWLQNSVNVYVDLANLLPEPEDFKEKLKDRLQNMELGKAFTEESKFKKIVGHGDLWSNNMLFRLEKGVAKECILLDYQVLRYFHPSFDVLLALYSNSNSDFRKQHAETLFQFYYEELTAIVKDYGYDIGQIYPESDFRESIEHIKLEAQFQAFATLSNVFLPVELLNHTINSGDADVLFGERREISRNAFNTDQSYKNVLTDHLYELNETLLRK